MQISNVNLPCVKKNDSHISVNAVFTFKKIENKIDNVNNIKYKNYAKNFSRRNSSSLF